MLKSLQLQGVGPVRDLNASFGRGLNIVTGDNGLGKSFLLDTCFWVLTGTWPGRRVATPDQDADLPSIRYEIESKTKDAVRTAEYNFKLQSWRRQRGRCPMPGLVIYAAVDGSFAVWDPARNYGKDFPRHARSRRAHSQEFEDFDPEWPRAFEFPPESLANYEETGTGTIRRDVANGLEEGGRVLCNGLIADWSEWFYQRSSDQPINAFKYLEEVVGVLSHPGEQIECGEPEDVFATDDRKFPTLRMPYGIVPYPHWSAGVKRIVSFAYLVVWAWVAHLKASRMRKEKPTEQIIFIVDEIEAHLHPKWQRTILPALIRVVEKLGEQIAVQMFAATHSPLVLASLEPFFNEDDDRLFWFDLRKGEVHFQEFPWASQGDVVGWLTSEIFGLKQARSKEAENAIEAAEAFMRGDKQALPPGLKTKARIHDALMKYLPGLDPFWPRWIVEAKP